MCDISNEPERTTDQGGQEKALTRRSILKASAAGLALGAAGTLFPSDKSASRAHALGADINPTAGLSTDDEPNDVSDEDWAQRARAHKGSVPKGASSPYSTDVFVHGITSGDPLPDAIILWTRITQKPTWTPGSGKGTPVRVKWEIGLRNGKSRAFTNAIRSGEVTTDAKRDFTVKVDATGLKPDTRYVYRFTVLDGPAKGAVSPVGCTQTAASYNAHNKRLRFAFLSCSNWEAGYWSTYRFLADRGDLDFVVHLGDWFYEYETNGYTGRYGRVRHHEFPDETTKLEHYRRRHANTKTDPDLQYCQSTYPFIVTWDDHESADNSYIDGAVNHQPEFEGDWMSRKAASARAYFEWMPTRVNTLKNGHLYRYFRFGTLMDMSVLDLRTYRDKQNSDKIDDPNRSIGGKQQMEWLRNNVVKSPCQWKVIGNPVMMAPLQLPPLNAKINDFVAYKAGIPSHGIVFNSDQWDGYQWDRQRLFDAIAKNNVKNVVAVTGDIHMSFANDLYQKANGDMNGRRVGVEFIGTSISAANVDDIVFDSVGLRLSEEDPLIRTAGEAIKVANQHIKYIEMAKHGYSIVEVNRNFTQCDFFYVDNKSSPKSGHHWDRSFATAANRSALYEVKRPLKF